MNEFELIDRYFRDCGARRADVRLGVGDDAALLENPPGAQLVAAIDTLVEGRHFPVGSPAASVGHRALAVNLSDLAAMGARPAWALMALTVPRLDEVWLGEFASGFSKLARLHEVALVGGDTTAGPLSVSVQLLGHVPADRPMRRSGGKPGDILFVSGTPGDAAAGLALEQSSLQIHDAAQADYLRNRFLYPTPRVEFGQRVSEFASACIDVSDGLFGDAGKLAAASGCGMRISSDLRLSSQLLVAAGEARAIQYALTGGDDYELCFAVPAASVSALESALPQEHWDYHRIGELTANAEQLLVQRGTVIKFSHSGFDHFGKP